MPLSLTQARGEFTNQLKAVYQERPPVTSFLKSFFPSTTSPTKTVSIEVERMGEKVAVDVVRGTEGNRNTFSRSSEKIYLPPLYREYFDATQLDLYDRVLGSLKSDNSQLFAALLNEVADRVMLLRDKIERSKEVMIKQIFETGVVTLNNGDNIDYKRKTASIVNSSGNYFASAIDPFAAFAAGCKFIREKGKSGDGVFNAILGDTAMADLLSNAKFLERQGTFNMVLDNVIGPVRNNNTGASYHGTMTCGSYKVQLWTYPQVYDHPTTGASTPYIDNKKVIMLPTNPKFVMAHAAVPQLIGQPGQMPVQGEYVFMDFADERKATHEYDVQSAPLPIPVAVDTIYTFQAVA